MPRAVWFVHPPLCDLAGKNSLMGTPSVGQSQGAGITPAPFLGSKLNDRSTRPRRFPPSSPITVTRTLSAAPSRTSTARPPPATSPAKRSTRSTPRPSPRRWTSWKAPRPCTAPTASATRSRRPPTASSSSSRSRFFRTWSRTPILWPAVQRLKVSLLALKIEFESR